MTFIVHIFQMVARTRASKAARKKKLVSLTVSSLANIQERIDETIALRRALCTARGVDPSAFTLSACSNADACTTRKKVNVDMCNASKTKLHYTYQQQLNKAYTTARPVFSTTIAMDDDIGTSVKSSLQSMRVLPTLSYLLEGACSSTCESRYINQLMTTSQQVDSTTRGHIKGFVYGSTGCDKYKRSTRHSCRLCKKALHRIAACIQRTMNDKIDHIRGQTAYLTEIST